MTIRLTERDALRLGLLNKAGIKQTKKLPTGIGRKRSKTKSPQRVLFECCQAYFKDKFQRDRERQNLLTLHGWRILRFTAKDVKSRLTESLDMIRQCLDG